MEHRKKVTAALSLFLVCVILMLYTSYAWLVVSSAPEVSNIETNVGANGSLEIALLNEETYIDPSIIRTGIGDSLMAQDPKISNTTWGNVIDLSAEEYGLQEISLKPSRLNVKVDAQGNYLVGNNLLQIADFGADGRVSFISGNTVSGVFHDQKFSFDLARQGYGVRGIGITEKLYGRQQALAAANALVPMYQASATRAAQDVWRENGVLLMDIWANYDDAATKKSHDHPWNGYYSFFDSTYSYSREEHDAVIDTCRKMLEAYDCVDLSIRHTLLGLASLMTDEEAFNALYEDVLESNTPLEYLGGAVPRDLIDLDQLAPGLREDMAAIGRIQSDLRQAISIDDWHVEHNYDHNNPNDFQWYGNCPQAYECLFSLVSENSYLNEHYLRGSFAYLTKDNVLTIHGKKDYTGTLAKYVGNFNVSFEWDERNVEVKVSYPRENDTLPLISHFADVLQQAAGSNGEALMEIRDLYGFAIDMAFRCNATTDLLLQTEQAVRMRETTETSVTQGGGSYVRFKSDDMSTEQLISTVDTIRLGFLDNRGRLVALAKPNTSNYKEDIDESITAPLYLYEFTVTADGMIIPGERRSEDTCILPLVQSSPEHLTALLWMDGDYVDNSMVSFISKDMIGVVNLQFTSSVDLIPASISENILADSAQPEEPSEPSTPTEPSAPSTPTAPTEPEN